MNRELAILLYTISGVIAAISQLMLKMAADNKYTLWWKKYINIKVIVAYVLLFSTLFVNMIAMRYMPYKYTPILATLSYIFVVVLGNIILKEKINRKQLFGTILIFLGIIVFNLN